MERKAEKNQITVNLREIFRMMLVQWRGVVVFAIVIGILLTGMKYRKDQSAARSAAKAANAEDAATASLTSAEKMTVEDTVQIAKKNSDLQKYMTDSILMKLDPYHVNVLTLEYIFSDQEHETAGTISQLYYRYLYSDEVIKALGEIIAPDITGEYISELLSVATTDSSASNAKSAYLTIRIMLPADKVNKDSLIRKTVGELISKYAAELKTQGYSADFKKVGNYISKEYEQTINDQQSNLQSRVMSTNSSLKTTIASFSNAQQRAFVQLCKDQKIDISSTVISEEDMSKMSASSDVSVHYSKKWFLAGAILGILIYLFVLLLRSAFSGRVQGVEEITYLYGLRNYAEFRAYLVKNPFSRLFHSRSVYRRIYRGKTDEEQAAQLAADRIGHSMRLGNFDGVDLVIPVPLSETAEKFIGHIVEILANNGRTAHVVSYSAGREDKQLSPRRILVYEAGQIDFEQVSEQMIDVEESKADMLGTVYIQTQR